MALFSSKFGKWNSDLHPRGRNGRFIEIGDFVKWLKPMGEGHGKVLGVDKDGTAVISTGGYVERVPVANLTKISSPKASIPKVSKWTPEEMAAYDAKKAANKAAAEAKRLEQEQLRDDIIEGMLGDAQPVANPKFDLVLGGGGSGKSTLIEDGYLDLPDDYALLDADIAKEMMPEYQAKIAAGDPTAASSVHNLSTEITSEARGEAFDRRLNTVLASVGSSNESMKRRVKQARSEGYAVNAHVATIDPDVAVERAKKRAEETGREVPESFIRRSARDTVRNTMMAINEGLYDHIELFDTTGKPPVRFAEAYANADGGSDLTVNDWAMWQQFLERGVLPQTIEASGFAFVDTAQSPLIVPGWDAPPSAYDTEVQEAIMIGILAGEAPIENRFADTPGFAQVWDELAAEIAAGANEVPFVLD